MHRLIGFFFKNLQQGCNVFPKVSNGWLICPLDLGLGEGMGPPAKKYSLHFGTDMHKRADPRVIHILPFNQKEIFSLPSKSHSELLHCKDVVKPL